MPRSQFQRDRAIFDRRLGVVRAQRDPMGRGRGQALVEVALMLPVFLLLTLGVVDGARLFGATVAVTNGVREAVLWASQDGQHIYPTDIRQKVLDEASGLDASQITVTATCSVLPPTFVSCDPATTYAYVRVAATYQMTLFFTSLGGSGGIGDFLPSSATIGETLTARIIPP